MTSSGPSSRSGTRPRRVMKSVSTNLLVLIRRFVKFVYLYITHHGPPSDSREFKLRVLKAHQMLSCTPSKLPVLLNYLHTHIIYDKFCNHIFAVDLGRFSSYYSKKLEPTVAKIIR